MKRSKFTEKQEIYALRQGGRRERVAPIAATGEDNAPLEAARRGSFARQAPVVGGAPSNSLRPARRRELAQWFRDIFSLRSLRKNVRAACVPKKRCAPVRVHQLKVVTVWEQRHLLADYVDKTPSGGLKKTRQADRLRRG